MSESVAVVPVTNGQVDFGGLMQLCEALVPTGFLPNHIKTAGQAAAIVLAGQELGMTPMLALRSIVMVQGKVVVSADAQLALFKARGGKAVFETLSEKEAVLSLVHPNGDPHQESFTMEDAKRAGLTNNPTWSKYPKAMLRSRVITAGLKSIGFEPTAGAYDPEEAQAFTVEATPENPTTAQSQSAVGSAPATTAPATPQTSATTSDTNTSSTPSDDELTADTSFPLGAMKGKTVREFTDAQLKWGVVEGRNLGPRTDEWQQIMFAELERRKPSGFAAILETNDAEIKDDLHAAIGTD